MQQFDKDFIFGAATASYQIEGARHEGGKTDSIWDTFSHTPGKIENGDHGDLACDHYHRFEEDVRLMEELGIDSYRFSIAWTRIFPEQGKYNPEGMAFYKKLVKRLKQAGIRPAATLYHWDLPQWLDNMGGWTARESVGHFLEYVSKCYDELGEDVATWITHNEPYCAGILGYMTGDHAPGIQEVGASLKAIHHILLSHGEAVKLFREKGIAGTIGITLNLSPVQPASDAFQDSVAANNLDGWMNRWFLDPLFKEKYPADMVNLYHSKLENLDFIKEGDLETIAVRTDFLGINYYHASSVKYNPSELLLFESADMPEKKTAMGWPVTPTGLDRIITRLREEYTELPILITENGAAYEDKVDADGEVRDAERTSYIEEHIRSVARLNSQGMNIRGYYLWSLLDNFEWAFGYGKRFGIVHIDFETLKRTPKTSYRTYKKIIASRSI